MQAYCFYMNEVFSNRSNKDKIYPLTTEKIAEAKEADASLKHLFNATQELIKNWRSSSLRTQIVSARWLAGYTQATLGVCSHMVSPLPTVPWTHTPQRDNERSNVLERYAYHHPVINKVMQILPN